MMADTFQAKTAAIPYQDRGMFFSELYLFALVCLAQGVTDVIESGVRNGVSTRVLHALFPKHVTSVELRPTHIPADFPFHVVLGDGAEIVPQLLDAETGDVGVLLDGPKGPKGKLLRDQLLEHPLVRVVALHDVPLADGEDFHSLDPAFRLLGDALDRRIPDKVRRDYPLGAPGLGVWVHR